MQVSRRVDSLERFHALSRSQLHDWLAAHHLTTSGMWLVTYRRATGRPRPSYEEIVEELLCVGWIDSRLRKLDELTTMLLCTPRSPTSQWSKSNKERVERLTRAGLMQPRGLEAVAVAKRNGAWNYLDDVENLVEPADLASALDASPATRRNWSDSPAWYRRGILYWILSAKRPGTRLSRIQRAVAAASANGRIQERPTSAQAPVDQAHAGPGTLFAAGDALTTRETSVKPRRSRPSPERGRGA